MKRLRLVFLSAGILIPVGLILAYQSSDRGHLGFLRSENAYKTIHGASYDYNKLARVDDLIVAAISVLFLALYFYSDKPKTTMGLISPLLKIAAILIGLFIFQLYIGLRHWG